MDCNAPKFKSFGKITLNYDYSHCKVDEIKVYDIWPNPHPYMTVVNNSNVFEVVLTGSVNFTQVASH